jgi:hypothetical protein
MISHETVLKYMVQDDSYPEENKPSELIDIQRVSC